VEKKYNKDYDNRQDVSIEIECAMCGKKDVIHFVPNRGVAVLCGECYRVKRNRKIRTKKIMEKVAGKFEITCEKCGIREEVNYKRYKSPVKLCSKCYEEVKGSAPSTARKSQTKIATAITCCKCGATDFVNFVPEDETKVLCRRCYRSQNEDNK